MSQRSFYAESFLDTSGNALSGLTATIKDSAGATATIYNQKSGGTTKANPITTGSDGLVSFWAEPGTYSVNLHDPQLPVRISDKIFYFEAVSGDTTGGIDDTQLETSPSSIAANEAARYRTIFQASGGFEADAIAATYLFAGGSGANSLAASPAGGAPFAIHVPLFYFDDADYTLSGLTSKLRLRFQIATNATAPVLTFTVGLYPITVTGGTDTLAYTAGTVVPGSQSAVQNPFASTVNSYASSDFTIPADGAYGLGVVTNAALTNNSAVSIHAQLQIRAT